MHEGMKMPEWRQGVMHGWHMAGRPQEMSEDHIHHMMQQALAAGHGPTALQVHDNVPDELKIDKVGDLLDEYRRSVLPPIETFRLQIDPSSDRGWRKAYEDYVRAGYPTADANAIVRQKRQQYETQRANAPMPELDASLDDAPMTDAQYQRRLALLRRGRASDMSTLED